MPHPKLPLLLLLLATTAASQAAAQATAQAPSLKGRVLDATTHLPVPYASLSLRNEADWTLANAKGHFELAAPKKSVIDTLLVECPGYLPHPVVVRNRALADSTLTLAKAVATLKTQPPNPAPANIRRLGSLAKRPGEGMIQGLMGSQFALLIEPSPKYRPGSVQNVSFYIGENGFPKEAFRIRLYRADGPNHSPGTNLLTENLIVAAPGGGKWFTVDVSKYLVEVPRDGFFVAMEWIKGPEPSALQQGYDPPGQVLRPTFEFKDSRTWSFTIGKGWQLLTLKTPESKVYNAMISTEIEEYK